mmetsp:Transcript_21298/g.59049  ORF Transcript_21298/g.59049 Transcript_21298/m.59049 type:complete len:391 (-) Transcript_21298:77-1249(-)
MHLVGVALLVHGLGSLSRALAGGVVLAPLGIAVGLSAGQQSLLGSLHVLLLALPGLQHGVLQSAGVGEGHVPGVGLAVHLLQVQGGLQLRLATRQEHDAGHSGGHTALQQGQSGMGHLLGGGTGGALGTGGHHGGLQQDALEQHLVVGHVLEGLGPHGLSHLQGALDGLLTVQQHLGLHNGNQASVLCDGGVAGQAVGAVTHGDGGGAVGDGHHGPPLGEAGAGLVVLGAPLVQAVQAHAPLLVVGVGQGSQTLVHLDTGHNTLVRQHVAHLLAVAAGLVQGLLEQDGTGDVLAQAGGGHQQLTVGAAVVLGVLHADGVQALAAGGIGLVHGHDTAAGAGDGLRGLDELLIELASADGHAVLAAHAASGHASLHGSSGLQGEGHCVCLTD